MNTFSNNIMISFVILGLLIIIIECISYLSNKYFMKPTEQFTTQQSTTGQNVDIPLTTTTSCTNVCGPTSKCSITKEQCLSDVDCTGCQSLSSNDSNKITPNVPGDNDAGKLTLGVTPQYSTLTNGYGTNAQVITSNVFSKPTTTNVDVNVWNSKYQKQQHDFNTIYKPPQLNNMPNYPERYSLTGSFVEDGPIASNDYL